MERSESAGTKARERILSVAIRMMAKKGYAETSFQKIADEVGVSQSAVIHHFPSKKELVKSMAESISRNNYGLVEQSLSMTDDAYKCLQKHFRTNVRWAANHPDEAHVVMMLLSYLATTDKEFSQLYEKRLQRARDRICRHIYAGIREKLWQPTESPEFIAEILQSSVAHAITSSLASAKRPSVKLLEKKWEVLLKKMLF